MTIKVAITGFGRIGRNVLRAHYELGKKHDIEIVAINAMGDIKTNAHLLRHDTVHGHFNADVKVEEVSDTEKYLIINGDRMRVFCDRDPRNRPWMWTLCSNARVLSVPKKNAWLTWKAAPRRC